MLDGELKETVIDLVRLRGVLTRSVGVSGVAVIKKSRTKCRVSTYIVLFLLCLYVASNELSMAMFIPFGLYFMGEVLLNNAEHKGALVHNIFAVTNKYDELRACVPDDGYGFCYDNLNISHIKKNGELMGLMPMLRREIDDWRLDSSELNAVAKLVRFNTGGFILITASCVVTVAFLLNRVSYSLPGLNIEENIAHFLSFGSMIAIVLFYVIGFLIINKALFASANKAVAEYFNSGLKVDKEN